MQRSIGRLVALAGALALLLATSAPSLGATGGRLDGNGHPNVGAMIVAQPPRFGAVPWCSGVLIAPTAFLTTGHCTAILMEPGAVLLGVTFAASFDPASSSVVPGTVRVPPGGDSAVPDALPDLALIELDAAPAGVTPAVAPTGDLGRALADLPDPDGPALTAVGYGLTGFLTAAGGGRAFDLQDYGIRRAAPLHLEELRPDALLLTGTDYPPLLQGSGSPCFGDSGGPVFADDAGMVVAINTATTLACTKPFAFTRLDTPAARAFLGRVIAAEP